jgi:hypothetical protein
VQNLLLIFLKSMAAAALVLPAAPALAGEYKDIYDTLEPFERLKDLKYVTTTVKVKPKDARIAPQSVEFIIRSKSGLIKVAARADGGIDFPVSRALREENPEMVSNQAEGALGIAVSVDVAVPPTANLDYRLIAELRDQYRTAVGRQNLMWRMLAPSPKGVLISFAPEAKGTAKVKLPGTSWTVDADEKGELCLGFDDDLLKANAAIELNAVPRRIGLDFRK